MADFFNRIGQKQTSGRCCYNIEKKVTQTKHCRGNLLPKMCGWSNQNGSGLPCTMLFMTSVDVNRKTLGNVDRLSSYSF